MPMEILAVRLPEEVVAQIDLLAEEAGLNRSGWLRATILQELAHQNQDWSGFLEENLEVLLKVIPQMSRKSQGEIYQLLCPTQPQLFQLSVNERKDLIVNLVESLVKTKSKDS